MADAEIFDSSQRHLVPGDSRLERLYTGCGWAEGPVYFADLDLLLWSDIPGDRLLRWAEGLGAGEFRCPSRYANGNTRDRQGRLVTCEHGSRCVTRTEADGSITVLAERYRGKRLNSPNDVVVASDGAVWFSDPPYGILSDTQGHKADSELQANYLFRLDPHSGELSVAADDFDRPNGLAFSPDEKRLYVTDTGRSEAAGGPPHIRVFEHSEQGRLRGGRVFADMRGRPADGLRLDTEGNVWTSAGAAVECYSPGGTLLARIAVPERVSNLAFGGPRRDRLFITATSSLYAMRVGGSGAQRP